MCKKSSNFAAKIYFFMKKSLFTILLVAVLFGLNSCNNNEPCRFNKKTIDLPVAWNEWKFDDVNLQFYTHFNIDAITADVYNYGNYSLHREYNSGKKNAYQVALPQSVFMVDSLGNGEVAYYTQHIDYRVGIGYVEIQVTNSDYFYPTDGQGNLYAPDDMNFRLELIY